MKRDPATNGASFRAGRSWVLGALAMPVAAGIAVVGTIVALVTAELGEGSAAIVLPLFVFFGWCVLVGGAGAVVAVAGGGSRTARRVSAAVCTVFAVPSFGLAWLAAGWSGAWPILPVLVGVACLAPAGVLVGAALDALPDAPRSGSRGGPG